MPSGTNLLQYSGLNPIQRRENFWNKRQEILNPIGPRHDEHHAEWKHRQILFPLKSSVHRDEGVGLVGGQLQEGAVFDARPAHALDR